MALLQSMASRLGGFLEGEIILIWGTMGLSGSK